MIEKITAIYDSAEDKKAQDFFLKYGHVALANVYDPSLGILATSVADKTTRYRTCDNLSGQIGDVRFGHLPASNPLKQVIVSSARALEQLGEPFEDISSEQLSAQVIDQRAGAEGVWHKDSGVVVTTIKGASVLEIGGNDNNVDGAYALIPGRIVVMDPSRRLWHRGVAGNDASRTGLAIHRIQSTHRN